MSTYGTLKEIGVYEAKKQQKFIDNITESSPILEKVKFTAASHAFWNAYEELQNVTGAAFTDLDAPATLAGTTTGLKRVDMKVMSAKIEGGQDSITAQGGKEAYFAKKLGPILRKNGMSLETAFYYQNWLKYAIDNAATNLIYAQTGLTSGTSYSSIVAVRFEENVTCGLYSPEVGMGADLFQLTPINGGNLYEFQAPKAGVFGYGMLMKAYLGMQIADTRTVAAIVNIDDSHVPSAMQMEDLLDMVRAQDGQTYLFMHRHTAGLIGTAHKYSKLRMDPEDMDISVIANDWGGIPIVTSHNLLKNAEEHVKDAS